MDSTSPHAIGERIGNSKEPHLTKGYDHCYVLRGPGGKLALAARAQTPPGTRDGNFPTEPAIQLYCGNFDGSPAATATNNATPFA